MLSWLPSIPYPPPQAGYWEPVTATLDWCEENYYATRYSAEVVNTFTNLMFLYLGVKGVRSCIKQGHDPIFLISFLGYLLVGSGSFMFHSTLKYPWQLVDELSMIYTTCIMFFATFAYAKTALYSLVLGILLVALSIFITLYYHYLQDPVFHQNAYALLTAIVLLRSMYIMEVNLRPQIKEKQAEERDLTAQLQLAHGKSTEDKAERIRQDQRDIKILKTMWTMVAAGLSIFLGGFAIWNLDNFFCSNLRAWRHEIGLPWGILLEGHGWWHIMTGIGAYYYIIWGIWLRHCLNGKQDDYELIWPRLFTSVPVIRRRAVQNGVHQNGSTHLRKKSN